MVQRVSDPERRTFGKQLREHGEWPEGVDVI
jgi:hypothetical protein